MIAFISMVHAADRPACNVLSFAVPKIKSYVQEHGQLLDLDFTYVYKPSVKPEEMANYLDIKQMLIDLLKEYEKDNTYWEQLNQMLVKNVLETYQHSIVGVKSTIAVTPSRTTREKRHSTIVAGSIRHCLDL
jgi:hypothetical protein